ncbi:hypothetical protein PN498_04445 [Oscillatoria sp. CS-180]|nr:DUF6516 family protein [Oscillatoria sp. CS-180]MDB9525226.1 hypothetical protein [Oscillatoria sp. CS-180]
MPHFPNLPHFPHHVHVGAEDVVEPSEPRSILQLLNELENLLEN